MASVRNRKSTKEKTRMEATAGGSLSVQPDRVIADLRELAARTGGPDGARRVCWSPVWMEARAWLRGKLDAVGCSAEIDPAGNLWATLPGRSPKLVVIGSHIDSVPHGGWLDGALGVTAALEILRSYAGTGTTPPVTLRLVDWADEEGARFGRSLFGSSAATGSLDLEQVRGLKDRDGTALPDALAACGVQLDRVHEAGSRLKDINAYLELHIEQGPVLERRGVALAAVTGTVGQERHAITFTGRASHSGSTPMDVRRDAFLCAARFALEARESARRHGGVATNGAVAVEPNIPTAIAGTCRVTLDQRHPDAEVLATMYAEACAAADRIAAEENTTVAWEPLFQIAPTPFHPNLVAFAEEACREVAGTALRLPSWPLHDAAEMAHLVPTTMLFVSSLNGISHSPLEDTPEEQIKLAVQAHALLAAKTIAWIQEQS
jgi:N-carbamoyl-L-amino-acid hydrolase